MLNSAPRYTQTLFHECVVFCNSIRSPTQQIKIWLRFLRAERKIPATSKVGYSGRLKSGRKIFNKWKAEFLRYFLLHKFCWWSNRKRTREKTGMSPYLLLYPSYTAPCQQHWAPISPTIVLQLAQSCFQAVQHLEWWKRDRLMAWLHSEFFPIYTTSRILIVLLKILRGEKKRVISNPLCMYH